MILIHKLKRRVKMFRNKIAACFYLFTVLFYFWTIVKPIYSITKSVLTSTNTILLELDKVTWFFCFLKFMRMNVLLLNFHSFFFLNLIRFLLAFKWLFWGFFSGNSFYWEDTESFSTHFKLKTSKILFAMDISRRTDSYCPNDIVLF